MMKKILSLFIVFMLCSGATYLENEQKYFFASDALIEALQNNVTDEQKRADAATVYSELMNQQTGMVSIDNLFAVCRAAGFNTYKKEGFDSCKQFINSLIELDEDVLSGFCPGLDAKGNNPNGLKSITDQTRIGDFCSSANIYAGEVVFKKGYNCTCIAYACNDGYEFKGGACVTVVADGQGFCLRSDNKIQKDMKLEEAKAFCENLATQKGCKYKSAVIKHKELRILCNATREEVDNAKQLMADNKEKQKAAIKYYEVCGKDKNKTGKKEYCVKDFFNWTQTQPDQAIGFAQDYAKIKNNHTIYCKNQHRRSGNDDYIACSTMDGSVLYEFKFDDIKESTDATRYVSERSALCKLAGGSDVMTNAVCTNLNAAQCANLDKLAKKYGHEAKWENNNCYFTNYGLKTMSSEDFDKSLAKIDGLDNYAFFNIQVISIRNNFALEEEMKKYIKNNLSGYQEVYCDPGYRTIKKADGFLQNVVGNSDDIKRCYANNKPIDFVVDDLSELAGYERDSGESGAKCISNDGKFDGHYCRGLTKDECFELERLMLKELKSHGWTGDDDLVDWDERAGACELNAAQFANNLNKTGKYTAIAGLTIAGVFTGGTTTAVAVSLMAVELAGMTGEMVSERQKELLPQRWANRFLAESTVCKQASCAEKTLRENMGKIAQASDMLNRDVLKQVDEELARLAELLPDDRLAEILQNPKAPGCWETWECQETLFTVMQMASLGAAVGKALVKLPQVLARKFGAVATKTAATGASHVDDIAKAASKADDVADAVWDATAKRFRDPKTGRFVSGYTSWTDELADLGIKKTVVNGKEVYTDAKTGAALSDVQVLNRMPSSMNDDFAKIGVRQVEQADGTIRYLDIRPGGGNKFISEAEVLKRIDNMPSAVKAVDNTTDAARAGNKVVNKSDDLAVITRKVGDKYDEMISGIKSGKNKVMYVPKGNLSENEWKVLQESLRKEGLEMMDVPGNASNYGIDQVMIAKRGTEIDGLVFGGSKITNKADDVADAARQLTPTTPRSAVRSKLGDNINSIIDDVKAGKNPDVVLESSALSKEEWKALKEELAREGLDLREQGTLHYLVEKPKISMGAKTGNAVQTASVAANKSDDLAVITRKVGDKYDEMISGIKSGKNKVMYVPKGNLSENEWKVLQESLRKEGLEMMDVPGNASNYGIDQVMIAKRGTEIDGLVFGGSKVANKADDMISINNKLGKLTNDLDGMMEGIKNDKILGMSIPKNHLSDSELRILKESINKEGMSLVYYSKDGNYWIVKSGTNARYDEIFGAGNWTIRSGAQLTNKADDIVSLRKTASSNFDTYLAEAKNSAAGKSTHKIPKSRLNDAGWTEINKSLAPENIQLVDTGDGYMQFVRANHVDDAARSSSKADDIVRASANATKNSAKLDKINAARKADNLGFHGTDADIAMTDKIRPSGNTSEQLGSVGFGIAKNYDDAERYAIRRLIERQNPEKRIKFYLNNNDVLEIRASEPLNLSNKTGYVYTTAKESNIAWETLRYSHSQNTLSQAARMPNAVEILDKTTFNLDDLIHSGKIKIIY